MCQNCQALQAEVTRLQSENEVLYRLLAKADQIIKAQNKQLAMARKLCTSIIRQAENKINKGGLPKGVFAYAKGAGEAVSQVYNVLKVDYGSNWTR